MSEKPVSFAILSTARIAEKVCPAIQATKGATVAVVAARDKAKAEKFAKERNIPDACLLDEVLERSDVDVIYCPLPSGVRNEWILKAAKAGKHIYAEKPFSGSVGEIQGLLDACKDANVQFMDGTMWYHSARTKEIEQKLRDGAVGDVQRVTAAFTFMHPSEEWLQGGDGRTDKTKEPMGCLGDQGWYPIGAILMAFNWDLPTKVLVTYTKLNNVDTIVACGGTLWFEGDRMATFDCGCMLAHRSQCEIVGTKGVIKVDDLVGGQGRTGNFQAYEVPFAGSTSYTLGCVMGKDSEQATPASDHTQDLVADMVSCVQKIRAGGCRTEEWPKRALAVHAVMCALFASSEAGGKEVHLNPDGSLVTSGGCTVQ
eukprot:gb/GFBE01054337.1/.p1 GENE.gb/GFBE01054337.1/~~gb/GFBE01054337.1/.p1  ORF type:complete len:370 (+),score=77.12 gb/GFBE01054337.1/:1-1110(+)